MIFGSGRSGTTILGESLNQMPRTALIIEPLKNSNSKIIDRIGFTGWSQYIPKDANDWPEACRYFARLFSHRVINPNHNNDLRKVYQANIWIHKFIRGNLLMPWVVHNFSIREPIYIVRNPYAVISSKLRHIGWGLNKERREQIIGPVDIPKFRYFEEFYDRYSWLFSNVGNYEEFLTASWLMENDLILENNKSLHWHTIKYEDLIIDPDSVLTNAGESHLIQS